MILVHLAQDNLSTTNKSQIILLNLTQPNQIKINIQ